MNDLGPTPLFLFSLPRSGSTLCQRIMGSHEDIATAAEPNILLPLLYSLKDYNIYSKYRHEYAARSLRAFCDYLPNGVDDYMAEIRKFVLRLYAKVARNNEKYFLDKTPVYHHIAEDIIRNFPEAKYIFLWRNPLAIISSLSETFHNTRWKIHHYEFDLFQGLANLIAAYQEHKDRGCAVCYEDIVLHPEKTWQKIFAYLELPFRSDVLANFSQVRLKKNDFGDPYARMPEYQILRQDRLDRWKTFLTNPLRKAWCRHYLHWIGRERLAIMGYDSDILFTELNATPSDLRFLATDFFDFPYGIFYRIFEFRIMRHKLQAWYKGQRIYPHK